MLLNSIWVQLVVSYTQLKSWILEPKMKSKQTFSPKWAFSFLAGIYSENKTSLNQVVASWSSIWRATKSPRGPWREQSWRSCLIPSTSTRAAASSNFGCAQPWRPLQQSYGSLSVLCENKKQFSWTGEWHQHWILSKWNRECCTCMG